MMGNMMDKEKMKAKAAAMKKGGKMSAKDMEKMADKKGKKAYAKGGMVTKPTPVKAGASYTGGK